MLPTLTGEHPLPGGDKPCLAVPAEGLWVPDSPSYATTAAGSLTSRGFAAEGNMLGNHKMFLQESSEIAELRLIVEAKNFIIRDLQQQLSKVLEAACDERRRLQEGLAARTAQLHDSEEKRVDLMAHASGLGLRISELQEELNEERGGRQQAASPFKDDTDVIEALSLAASGGREIRQVLEQGAVLRAEQTQLHEMQIQQLKAELREVGPELQRSSEQMAVLQREFESLQSELTMSAVGAREEEQEDATERCRASPEAHTDDHATQANTRMSSRSPPKKLLGIGGLKQQLLRGSCSQPDLSSLAGRGGGGNGSTLAAARVAMRRRRCAELREAVLGIPSAWQEEESS